MNPNIRNFDEVKCQLLDDYNNDIFIYVDAFYDRDTSTFVYGNIKYKNNLDKHIQIDFTKFKLVDSENNISTEANFLSVATTFIHDVGIKANEERSLEVYWVFDKNFRKVDFKNLRLFYDQKYYDLK